MSELKFYIPALRSIYNTIQNGRVYHENYNF